MTAKYLTAALLVAALGCAQSTTPTQPVVAQSHAPLTKKTPPRVLRPVGVAQSMQPLANEPHVVINKTKEGGIGLHGPEKTYLEQVDPSGWSGRSVPANEPPTAIGGGPAATSDESTEEQTSGND
jgi:hypothetical protein